MLTPCQYKFVVPPHLFSAEKNNKQPSWENGCLSHLSQKCDHCFAGFPCLYSACHHETQVSEPICRKEVRRMKPSIGIRWTAVVLLLCCMIAGASGEATQKENTMKNYDFSVFTNVKITGILLFERTSTLGIH